MRNAKDLDPFFRLHRYFMQSERTNAILPLAFLLGIFYTGVVGFGNTPFGLQATLWTILFGGTTLLLLKLFHKPITRTHIALAIAGTILAIYGSITTNPLVSPLNDGVTFVLVSLFLLTLFRGSGLPTSAASYTLSLASYLAFGFVDFLYGLLTLRFVTMLKLLPVKKTLLVKKEKQSSQVWIGIAITIPVLVIFHILFAQINTEYAGFMKQILDQIWRIIKWIFDIDFIWFIIKTWFATYVLSVVFSLREPETKQEKEKRTEQLKTVMIVLVSTMALFALFSFFQGKLLFANIPAMAFKTLSTYTQEGFWQLIMVSIIGYALSLVVLAKLPKSDENSRLNLEFMPITLTVFTGELLLITVFSYHKLGFLQYLFGFKDQRLLATAGVTLIAMTCILSLGRIWQKLTAERLFAIQLWSLLGITILFNVMNVDLFVSKYNPISYYVSGKKYTDYSYLLGNSYDNHEEWIRLMKQTLNQKPPQPEDYYWGWYEPLCRMTYSRYNSETEKSIYLPTTYLSDRYAHLREKYRSLSWKMPLTKLTQVNWNEYQAYHVLEANKDTVYRFIQFAQSQCPAN